MHPCQNCLIKCIKSIQKKKSNIGKTIFDSNIFHKPKISEIIFAMCNTPNHNLGPVIDLKDIYIPSCTKTRCVKVNSSITNWYIYKAINTIINQYEKGCIYNLKQIMDAFIPYGGINYSYNLPMPFVLKDILTIPLLRELGLARTRFLDQKVIVFLNNSTDSTSLPARVKRNKIIKTLLLITPSLCKNCKSYYVPIIKNINIQSNYQYNCPYCGLEYNHEDLYKYKQWDFLESEEKLNGVLLCQ